MDILGGPLFCLPHLFPIFHLYICVPPDFLRASFRVTNSLLSCVKLPSNLSTEFSISMIMVFISESSTWFFKKSISSFFFLSSFLLCLSTALFFHFGFQSFLIFHYLELLKKNQSRGHSLNIPLDQTLIVM